MKKFQGSMRFGGTYYVFGRTAGNEVAFNSDDDYSILLSKYSDVIQPNDKLNVYNKILNAGMIISE